jgi:TolB protein
MKSKAGKQAALVSLLALIGVGSALATAQATTPGANGAIAFRRYFDATQETGAVFTVGADGKGERQVTTPPAGGLDDQPDWAPDGSLIAFSRCVPDLPCHVFVVAPDGTGLAPVGQPCPAVTNPQTCPDDANASFSPDSQRIALTQSTGRDKKGAEGDQIQHSAIAIANRDGSDRHVIYQGAPYSGDLVFPVFSPNGKQLVFESVASIFSQRAGERAIFTIGVSGSHPRRITPWAEGDGDNPDWSPDGKWIVFHSHVDDDSRQSQIFVIHPDGSGRKQLTHFAGGTKILSSSFSPDGKSLAISKGTATGNAHVFTLRLSDGRMQRVTHSTLWESAPDWGPAS